MIEPIKVPQEPVVPETITITKEQFEKFQKSIDDLKSKTEFLESVADRKQVANWYARHKEKLPVHVRLRTIRGKVIVGWKTVIDEVYKDASGRWVENQQIELAYEDGEAETMSYANFSRTYDAVKCERIGQIMDEKDNLILKLKRLDNGKEYEVGVQFVN